MAFDTALKLVLLGQDKSASRALKGVGTEAGKTHGKLGKLGGMAKGAGLAVGAGLLIAGAAAVKFGGDSLAAFADAEKSQAKLTDAYARFPKTANVSIDALRKYNQTLQRKTGADADDIAAGQATLAMFKLTGKQIKDTTPLLVDYAAKTGKSLPDSAKMMGKALLGNTKALKDMGISYKSTGDAGKDYANISALLQEKVGGYADSVPDAEKKSKILAATFGDLQEGIGEKLQPALMGLMDAGQGVLDWLDQNPQATAGASAAFDLLGQALGGLWDIIRKYVLPGLAWLIEAEGNAVKGIAGMLHALGKVPGFEWAEKAATSMDTMATGIFSVANGIKSMSRDPKIDTGAAVAKSQVEELDRKIKGLKGKQVKAEAKGDTKEVDRLKAKIDKLKGKKVDVQANVRKTGINGIRIRDIARGNIKISAYASGIGSAPGGLAMLGDGMGHSPEMAYLAPGSRVLSTGQTRARQNQTRSSSGGGGDVIQIAVQGDTDPFAAARRIERQLYLLKKRKKGPLSFER